MRTIQPYTFKGTLHHPWDGDTLWLIIDRGEGWQSKGKYRLFGVDTPEIRGVGGEEKIYGWEAKAFVQEFLTEVDLIVSTLKGNSKYDWMVEIWVITNSGLKGLAETIVAHGHGVPYDGGTKLPWPERKAIQDKARHEMKLAALREGTNP